jgi:hypothetical protein
MMMKNNITEEETLRDIKKVLAFIGIWIVTIIFLLLFTNLNKQLILGCWFLTTGIIMQISGKRYEKWYFENKHNLEKCKKIE